MCGALRLDWGVVSGRLENRDLEDGDPDILISILRYRDPPCHPQTCSNKRLFKALYFISNAKLYLRR